MDAWLTRIVDLQRLLDSRIGCIVPLDDLIGMSPEDIERIESWLSKQPPEEFEDHAD